MKITQFTSRLLVLCLIGFSTLAQGKIANSILSQLNISSTISGKIEMTVPGKDNQGNRRDFMKMVDLTQSLQLSALAQ